MNHEELISTLGKTLAEIADALPRAEIKLRLYTTPAMQDAVARLFAYMILFARRAVEWYSESKLKKMFHAIIHPVPLYYKDLLESISTSTERIDKLADDAAQAEQREMHQKLDEMRQLIVEHQSLNASKLLDIAQYVRQIQHSQVVDVVARSVLPSPQNSLQFYRAMSARRRSRGRLPLEPRTISTLHDWGGSRSSKLVSIKGSFRTSHQARDLAASIISLIQSSGIPVIWILNFKQRDETLQPSVIDVLKLLAYQILQMNLQLRDACLDTMHFQAAQTESDWLNILAGLLQGLPEIYIIFDVETLDCDLWEVPEWPSLFLKLFRLVREKSMPVNIKVALVSYGTNIPLNSDIALANLIDISKIKSRDRLKKSIHLQIQKRNRALKRDTAPSYAG